MPWSGKWKSYRGHLRVRRLERERLLLITGSAWLSAPMIRAWLESARQTSALSEEILKDLGLDQVKPIGAENLQALLTAHGHDPNATEVSRMLIEARDEE